MTAEEPRLTAEDYSYRLPDHWILHERDEPSIFATLHAAYVGRVAQIVQRSGAKSVLEVGCGDGWNCGKFAEAGHDVVGIDWSRNGIAYASRLVPNASFHCGDIRDRDFRDRFPSAFDSVVLIEVLEHIPPEDCAEALRSVAQLVKPNGLFVLTTPSVNYPNNNPQHYRHFDERTLRQLVTEAGNLTIESIEGYGDVVSERKHYDIARWIDNRYFQIKPAKRYLLRRYAPKCLRTPLDRCHGFIMVMRRGA